MSRYYKYEAFPAARFWVWHHQGWVKLTLRARPYCEKCGGWLNQRNYDRRPQMSVCISCEHKQMATFRDHASFGFSYRHDEGYSYERSTYVYESGYKDGAHIVEEWENGGRDCDGPISHNGTLVCSLDELQRHPVPDYSFRHPTRDYFNGAPIFRPEWHKVGRDVTHDAYAEAAGY